MGRSGFTGVETGEEEEREVRGMGMGMVTIGTDGLGKAACRPSERLWAMMSTLPYQLELYASALAAIIQFTMVVIVSGTDQKCLLQVQQL